MADAPAAPAAPAAPDTQLDDANVPDVPLSEIGNQPAADDKPAETPPSSDSADGKDAAAADQPDQGKGDGKPAENKPAEGDDKQPTETADEAAKKEQPADESNKDLTPEDRQRLAAQAYQNRQRQRNQVAGQIDQFYAPKSEEDLVQEGLSESDAKVEALRQEMLFSQQRTQIAELNADLRSQAVEVEHDMPVFDEKSSSYDPEFTQQVQAAYLRASRLQTDENGIVLNAEQPLYDFYKSMHDIYARGNTQGAVQQQSDALAMQAAVENPGGSSSTSKGEESLEDMEARLGDVVIGS